MLFLFISLCLSQGAFCSLLKSSIPAAADDILRTAYPIGNGFLGAMPYGPAGAESILLNVDSLWSGGPFENSTYNGNNPDPSSPRYPALDEIRSEIFKNGEGNTDGLLGGYENYGSYRVLGNLTVSIDGVTSKANYSRTLELTTGIHQTRFEGSDRNNYEITTYCSNPASVCVYDISSSGILPAVTFNLSNALIPVNLYNATCESNSARFSGLTQESIGMQSEAYAAVKSELKTSCDETTGTVTVLGDNEVKQVTIVWSAGTNYDMKKGTAEFDYSFRSDEDIAAKVQSSVSNSLEGPETSIRESHIQDFSGWMNEFTLTLSDTAGSKDVETSTVLSNYNKTIESDPYFEQQLFEYGRYLLVSSSREGSLPPNLQGIWADGLYNPWSADYHVNINLQMNLWGADQTGLGSLQSTVWEMMQWTWVPRGTQSAELIYGGEGWVLHNEINIFGYTGMKTDALWANYPAGSAWMMQHVWDYYEYSGDVEWFKTQGYPLLKGVALFWLSQLQQDIHFNDGTLLTNPCNSAEVGPTTFGCAHDLQLIHQVFESILTGAEAAGETDDKFVTQITESLTKLDKGVHVGAEGQIMEWKMGDIKGWESQSNNHRHLSHLIGWYPGWSISSFANGYTNKTIQDAVATSLERRGVGIIDQDTGWQKVWRSACWARLNQSSKAYEELQLTIYHNIAPNGLSMYSGRAGGGSKVPFQIDANFGFVGAVLSMLIVDLPLSHDQSGTRNVVVGPAIPAAWGNGSVSGLRLRGGGSVDFLWDENGVVTKATTTGVSDNLRLVNVKGEVL